MIGKLKRILGIEGVKINLSVQNTTIEKEGKIEGLILLSTLKPSKVNAIKIKLIERYERGRKQNQKIDEYVVASEELNELVKLAKNEKIEIPFSLPYQLVASSIDKFGEQNFFYRGIAKLAKWTNKVKSTYRLEVIAEVDGTSLSPKDVYVFNKDTAKETKD